MRAWTSWKRRPLPTGPHAAERATNPRAAGPGSAAQRAGRSRVGPDASAAQKLGSWGGVRPEPPPTAHALDWDLGAPLTVGTRMPRAPSPVGPRRTSSRVAGRPRWIPQEAVSYTHLR